MIEIFRFFKSIVMTALFIWWVVFIVAVVAAILAIYGA